MTLVEDGEGYQCCALREVLFCLSQEQYTKDDGTMRWVMFNVRMIYEMIIQGGPERNGTAHFP